MQGILNALDFILSTIKSIWGFFTSAVEHITLFFRVLLGGMQMAGKCILSMPEWLQMFAICTLGVCILYFVVNRDGGKSD